MLRFKTKTFIMKGAEDRRAFFPTPRRQTSGTRYELSISQLDSAAHSEMLAVTDFNDTLMYESRNI